jgi:signal transduction histidine kinase
MTRRIALTFFALIVVLLVLAVVPLGVSKSENQRASFRYDTNSAARIVGSDAEELLADHRSADAMRDGLASTASSGDCAAVYDANGTQVAQTPCGRASGDTAHGLVTRVLAGDQDADPEQDLTARDGQWLLVGVPVGDDGQSVGVVVYARDADPMDDRIDAMWGWLALTGLGCLALAGLLSARLARWVSRPLGTLGDAASRLGAGDLAVRAGVIDGPEQVRRLGEAFDWMAERIETLVHSQRSWIADVSHQLRTPLTALRLRLDLLAADLAEPGLTVGSPSAAERAAAELAGAQEEIARLSRLVDGLLAVARADSSVPARTPVRADTVAAERVAAWDPVAAERGVTLTLRAPGPVTVALGEGDLEQILDNLVANAVEAVASAGTVRLEVAHEPAEPRPRARATVRVVDDGPGMTDEQKAAAFHRYGHPEPRGNGLGLAIVHRLTAANAGTATLADTPGGGLTVTLDWPAHDPDAG